jgi:hypothetical protein
MGPAKESRYFSGFRLKQHRSIPQNLAVSPSKGKGRHPDSGLRRETRSTIDLCNQDLRDAKRVSAVQPAND